MAVIGQDNVTQLLPITPSSPLQTQWEQIKQTDRLHWRPGIHHRDPISVAPGTLPLLLLLVRPATHTRGISLASWMQSSQQILVYFQMFITNDSSQLPRKTLYPSQLELKTRGFY